MLPPDEPVVLPLLPFVKSPDSEGLEGSDESEEQQETGAVGKVADAAGQSTSNTDTDPYFGLLTDPPGQWGMVTYGNSHGLVIKGGRLFLERSLNLLHSYIEGLVQRADYLGDGYVLIPIFRERLVNALSLWFYSQIFRRKAKGEDIYSEPDEDGDTVFMGMRVDNDEEMLAEGRKLAHQFVASIMGHALGCSFESWQGPSLPEQGMSRSSIGRYMAAAIG